MQWAKRIFLFLAINCLVVLTISLIFSFLHVKPYLTAKGLDYQALLIFCLIWGIVGSLISLLLSRKIAQWMLGIRLIDPMQATLLEKKVLKIVKRLTRSANLTHTPDVGIFSSPVMNALATGATKKRSLVAISSGLLDHLDDGELEAVLAHEISHIANGDMVTMTLIQGIVNAFVMFLARILAFALSFATKDRNSSRSSFGSFYLLSFLFEVIFMIFGSMVVSLFSRIREYRADYGGAILSSKEKMISALERLSTQEGVHSHTFQGARRNHSLNALMIARPNSRLGWIRLFSSHPPLQERIKRLKSLP